MSPIPYTPPGVSISQSSSPSITVALAAPGSICLVGPAGVAASWDAPLTAVDVILLTGTTAQILPSLAELNSNAQLVSVVSVTDVLNPGWPQSATIPAWSSGGTYITGNIVTYLGNFYNATQSVGPSATTPSVDTTHWAQLFPGSGYLPTDYTVTLGEGPPDGADGTIKRAAGSNIASGTLVQVTYTYLPNDYWDPVLLSDIASVEARFGPSWATAVSNTTGQSYYTGVGSQLSMGARLAFSNGVQSIICQPLFARATPGDPTSAQQAPTADQVGEYSTWADTLYNLRSVPNIGSIVPVVGQDGTHVTDSDMLQIFTAFQSHLIYMNSFNQPMIAIFGEDGSAEGIGNANTGLMSLVRNTHAPTLQANFPTATQPIASQCALINNTLFQMTPPGGVGATVINVGGQYCAAAVAGAVGARSASTSLTRQPIAGFQSITDPRTPNDKNLDAGAGLMVIEQVNGLIRCRQAITLDITGGAPTSELSVQTAKFQMIQSIQSLLDNQIIGQIIADANSPIIVASAISSVLSLLQQSNVIVAYTAPTAALTTLNPTTITASFSYQPAFPVNYIDISFSLDLTTGAVQING